MITSFDELLKKVKTRPKKTIAVAMADEHDVLSAVSHASQEGIADAVLVGDKENIIKHLEILLSEINNLNPVYGKKLSDKTNRYFQRFSRLERAIMNTQTPESFRSEEGQEIRSLLNKIRLALDPGRPLPKIYLN